MRLLQPFTRAAEKLGITQQSLSALIKRTEENYGLKLIERTNPIKLTYAGQRFRSYCHEISSLSSALQSEFKEIKNEENGQISIGITGPRGYSLLPSVCKKFSREYPNIEIKLIETSTSEIEKNIADEKVEFGILITDQHNPKFNVIPIAKESPMLFASKEFLQEYCPIRYDYLLANQSIPHPISYFKDCPFAVNTGSSRIRAQMNRLFDENCIEPKIIFSSNNTLTINKVVSMGIAAAILNKNFLLNIGQAEGLLGFEIRNFSNPVDVNICYLKTKYLSKPCKRLIELLQLNAALT